MTKDLAQCQCLEDELLWQILYADYRVEGLSVADVCV